MSCNIYLSDIDRFHSSKKIFEKNYLYSLKSVCKNNNTNVYRRWLINNGNLINQNELNNIIKSIDCPNNITVDNNSNAYNNNKLIDNLIESRSNNTNNTNNPIPYESNN